MSNMICHVCKNELEKHPTTMKHASWEFHAISMQDENGDFAVACSNRCFKQYHKDKDLTGSPLAKLIMSETDG